MQNTKMLLALAVGCTAANFTQASSVDPNLPVYQPVSGVSGNLDSIGSDTLNNLMTLWAESFSAIYPNVHIQIEGKGSSTAPPALIEGTSQLGPMSREMKSTEIDKFESAFGYKPFKIGVSLDALAVFAHKDNPIEGLDLKQVDGIFSSTLKRGGDPVSTWGQLGLDGAWASRSVSVYGRNSASGTYGFFKDVALLKGDYKSSVKEQPGSSAVVQGIGSDLYGIGYSGIGYKTSGVKVLSLSVDGGKQYPATLENCISGDYPLARLLYIYINKNPVEKLDTLTKEFLKFVLSKEGQEIVVKDGYYPLPASIAKQYIAELEK
ncbi:MAG: PstS family phosphate ABC transporter substrate-binding protein [Puniceicoccaceae bacterium]